MAGSLSFSTRVKGDGAMIRCIGAPAECSISRRMKNWRPWSFRTTWITEPGLQSRVNFDCEWTLPAMIKLGGDKLCSWEDGPFKQLYDRLLPTRGDGDIIHRCGGYPENTQGDMRLECQLVSHGLYCGDASGYKDPGCAVLEKGASDWKLLLQVDSDHKRFRWMWGDAGRVLFLGAATGYRVGRFQQRVDHAAMRLSRSPADAQWRKIQLKLLSSRSRPASCAARRPPFPLAS